MEKNTLLLVEGGIVRWNPHFPISRRANSCKNGINKNKQKLQDRLKQLETRLETISKEPETSGYYKYLASGVLMASFAIGYFIDCCPKKQPPPKKSIDLNKIF